MTPEIDLSGEWLGLPSPDHVRDAAKAALDAGETHYTSRPGIVPLRRAIADLFLVNTGVATDPLRQVLITCGEEEGIFVVIHTLVAAGDDVLIVGPSPDAEEAIVRQAGGHARHLHWPDEGEDPDSWMAAGVTPALRVILTHTPSLTGQVLPAAATDALVRAANSADAAVVSIETLADFTQAGERHRGFAGHSGAQDRTVTIGGFGAWGLDGWRVGYLLGPESLVAPMTNFKQALTICSPALGQYAALAALTGSDEHLQQTRAALDSRRSVMVAELNRGGVPITAPPGGYQLFVPVPPSTPDPVDQLRESVAVLVSSGAAVGVAGTVRLTLSEPATTLVEAARRISPLLQPGGGRTDHG
jgi:aspartate/methionine/tyrosine aminotransferase